MPCTKFGCKSLRAKNGKIGPVDLSKKENG